MVSISSLQPYEILGVPANAKYEDIRKAYRDKALKHHPDKDASEDATAHFQQIQNAWEVLKSTRLRFLYDSGARNLTTKEAALQQAAREREENRSIVKSRLMEACKSGATFEVMKLLRGGNGDTNALDETGRSALMHAAERQRDQIVNLFILYKADVEVCDCEGWTATMSAVSAVQDAAAADGRAHDGNAACLLALLKGGANPNAKTKTGVTPLLLSCASGNAAMTNALLSYAADISIVGDSGVTALILAADSGHAAIVRALLSAAASVDTSDSNGRTALMAACALAHRDVVSLLLEAGADVHRKNNNGYESLLCAIDNLGNDDLENETDVVAVVSVLLAAQANPNVVAEDGRTPLWLAAEFGNADVVESLLRNGADPLLEGSKDRHIGEVATDQKIIEILQSHTGRRNLTSWNLLGC